MKYECLCRVLLACLLGAAASIAAAQKPSALATPTEKLDYLLTSWRGKTLEELLGTWGPEETLERRGGNQVYVFERRVKMRAGVFGVSVYTNGGLRCVAKFEIDAETEQVVRTARQGGGQECWNAFRRYEP